MSRAAFEPRGMATGIGSLPHVDPGTAVATVLRHLPDCPFWPQLPRLGPGEGMTLQYTPGLPGLVERDGGAALDTEDRGPAELPDFYQDALSGDLARFALDPARSKGFSEFLRAVEAGGAAGARCLKGHVTGPVTLASSLKDPQCREILTDETFREAVATHLAKNAAWQVSLLGRAGKPVIVFLDEPVMEVFGSAYSTLDAETVLALWTPVLDAIRDAGAFSGIHCCGNTDWGLLLSSGVDIVNFDAFGYLEKFCLYASEINAFLKRGGILAWGIVPTDARANALTVEDSLRVLKTGMDTLIARGVDRRMLAARSLLTPACGMGSLDEPLAERILTLLAETSRRYAEVAA